MLLNKHRRQTVLPEQSSVCWHPRRRTAAEIVNNPLHFWGELSALKGFDEKTIKRKHSSSIQESGLRQPGWADALFCLARACEGDTSLTALASVRTGANWQSLERDQAGVGGEDRASAVEEGSPHHPAGPLREQTLVLSLPPPGILRVWRNAGTEELASKSRRSLKSIENHWGLPRWC